MARLSVFNSITLDGYFCGPDGDLSWGFSPDTEWQSFVEGNARGGGVLLFGRVTYEHMASFWPTPAAAKSYPVVAERMNSMRKFVFSKTLDKATWSNTTLLKGNISAEVQKMKKELKEDIAILGSGSIVSQLAQEGLIDEFQFALFPIVLGKGRSMFEGVKRKLSLKLVRTRTFKNGNVLLTYEPVRA